MTDTPETAAQRVEELPSSQSIGEAMERLFTLAGISMDPAWCLSDPCLPRKMDEVRERMENLYKQPDPRGHLLYVTADPDAPNSIKDRNGEVVLSLCRVCLGAESELSESCTSRLRKVLNSLAQEKAEMERELAEANQIIAVYEDQLRNNGLL